MTDGLFDIVVLRNFPRIMGAAILLRALQGTILSSRYVTHYRASDVVLEHPSLNRMQVDGDAHPANEKVHFTMQAGAVKTLVP